ncbi:glycosyltransferase family 2 protein [Acinetobacter pollinis]|uniref:glycosyltransferase family 2 protein n=1 Tax=Acinetobacter pollinis TaxID=2605270 RepID=UPI0018A25375|nr:glycosyltransferase [Acinetobacter pollinis]MBF7689151.1 glycosyltransferase [Acinetobacter pollinis]MBF7691812.1 glycosyltransferase [Acinetobacter pollinis]MBF7698341.1 glycosyltransferase [Acinetobacter pollinis]MBF7699917.1 glycosyltransferase [Acinetobacter pollinis]
MMRVAVITPYYKEPLEQLIRCHQSVLIQKANVTHFLVSDGYPKAVLDQWDCEHIRLSHHNDYGDTPRGIGAASASAQGFDAICFLDADNWYEPHHLETMISTFKRYRIPVVTTSRALYTNDGQYLGQCKESDGIHFVDTNCYFFHKSAFELCSAWLFKPKGQSIVGDRILWKRVQDAKVPYVHHRGITVNYVTDFAVHYQMFNLTPPSQSRVYCKNQCKFISYKRFVEQSYSTEY